MTGELSENDRWLLSYYRSSEINGALFFGRVARTIKGPLQVDLTHHFADEAAHAHYWTECLTELDTLPLKLDRSYQDRYLEAVGLPANLMEIMAITQTFERRVIGQYRRHLCHPGTAEPVRRTITRIMVDERWHIHYVNVALAEMAGRYGQAHIDQTLARFAAADREVYARTLAEYGERIAFLTEEK